MSDTSSYDIELYALMDCNDHVFSSFAGVRMEMGWVSPSGKSFSEEVWLNRSALSEERYFWKSFRTPYRTGVVPAEDGQWTLSVEIDEDVIRRYNISCVGIEVSDYGAR